MSGLVSGHSGIIAPANLATNGSFIINQRGAFNTAGAVLVGDYLADNWKVLASSIDVVNCHHAATASYLRFYGSGKKGQSIEINNIETSPLGLIDGFNETISENQYLVTSSLRGMNKISSVPIQIACAPRKWAGGLILEHNQPKSLKAGEYGTAVRIYKTNGTGVNSKGFIYAHLEEDGDFDFYLAGFSEVQGGYKNPPPVGVHYADDLARCQRYYQTGNFFSLTKFVQYNTDDAHTQFAVKLQTKMASNPTITLTPTQIFAYDGAGASADRTGEINGSTRALVSAGNTDTDFRISTTWAEATYAAQMYTNGGLVKGTYTAEIV